jgi:hypothetical protein
VRRTTPGNNTEDRRETGTEIALDIPAPAGRATNLRQSMKDQRVRAIFDIPITRSGVEALPDRSAPVPLAEFGRRRDRPQRAVAARLGSGLGLVDLTDQFIADLVERRGKLSLGRGGDEVQPMAAVDPALQHDALLDALAVLEADLQFDLVVAVRPQTRTERSQAIYDPVALGRVEARGEVESLCDH